MCAWQANDFVAFLADTADIHVDFIPEGAVNVISQPAEIDARKRSKYINLRLHIYQEIDPATIAQNNRNEIMVLHDCILSIIL